MGKFLSGLAEELSLACRQLGWLHAVPEPPKKATGEPDRRSRMQRLIDAGSEPQLPEVGAEHLMSYLLEIGPSMPGAMGPVAISNTELHCWQENCGVELTAWEARTLRRLSRDYVGELLEATDPKRPSPCGDRDAEKANAAQSMRAAMRRVAKL